MSTFERIDPNILCRNSGTVAEAFTRLDIASAAIRSAYAEIDRYEKLIDELYMWADLADGGRIDPNKSIRLIHDILHKELNK